MKLLLISDHKEFLNKFDRADTGYQYGSIHIQFLHYHGLESLELIREKIKNERFHLVLICTKSQYSGPYVKNASLVNTVNNYLAIHLRKNANYFEESDIIKPPVSLVNRTTSYFNIFLEIPKAVGITTIDNKFEFDLPRLDIISETNYYFAYFLQKSKCNYYILNYDKELMIEVILDILAKLD